MSKHHVKVVNNSTNMELNVNSDITRILFEYINKTEKGQQAWDAMDPDKINSALCGVIYLKYVYDKYLDKINEYFQNTLIINFGKKYVYFEDPLVRAEMSRMFGDSDGGVIATSITKTSFYNEFEHYQMIGKYGEDNWQIRSFNELSKFPTITELSSSNGWTFFEQNLLESIDLSCITTLGQNTFCGCSSLKYLGDTSNIKTMRIGGQFNGCVLLESFDLSPQLTTLPPQVFQDCTLLASIDLSHVTSIGNRAFQNCTSLASVDISNVTSMGYRAFEACPIETVVLNENLTAIPEFCFYNCTQLKIINLSNVTSLGMNAFNGCNQLSNIDFSNIATFDGGCFNNCTSLGVNEILDFNLDNASNYGSNLFRNTGYKEIILHETTYHKISGFAGSGQMCSFGASCSNLIKIDLSDTKQTGQEATYSYNVTTIILPETWTGSLAGRDWGTSLLYIVILRTDPPAHTHSDWDWFGLPSNCAMYVPDEAYDDYISVWVTTGGSPSERIKKHSNLPETVTWYTKEHPSA